MGEQLQTRDSVSSASIRMQAAFERRYTYQLWATERDLAQDRVTDGRAALKLEHAARDHEERREAVVRERVGRDHAREHAHHELFRESST